MSLKEPTDSLYGPSLDLSPYHTLSPRLSPLALVRYVKPTETAALLRSGALLLHSKRVFYILHNFLISAYIASWF